MIKACEEIKHAAQCFIPYILVGNAVQREPHPLESPQIALDKNQALLDGVVGTVGHSQPFVSWN